MSPRRENVRQSRFPDATEGGARCQQKNRVIKRTDLVDSITEPDVAEGVRRFMDIAVPAGTFANIVSFAISQPEDVAINEILFRPTRQEL